ncbi:MAG: ATP-binding protein [Marmoricola sp.]
MSYEQSALWERTLAPRPADPEAAPREQLRFAFEQFRRHVEPLASEISLSVPGYTDHSVNHCDALWDTASLVAGPDYPLNPAEAFVLGGSFLIHDLAMGLAAYEEGLPGILATESWADLLWAKWPHLAQGLHAQALVDVGNNPTWDGLSSQLVKAALTEFLRESHAAQAALILDRQWKLSSGDPFYLLADTELRHWYGELIGKVARSHWLDVSELVNYLPGTLGTPSGLPLSWTVDPIKIASLLRLADASQIDARRAEPLHTPFRNPQGDSRLHWEFQERMLHPRIERDRIEYTSSSSFDADQAEAWWLAYDAIQMIQKELQAVDALCGDLGKPRMAARGVAGADDPQRFARYVQTVNWTPIDARPHIRDPLGVIDSLGGVALYGQQHDVPIRELLANGVDASRARRAAQGNSNVPAVQIKFGRDSGGDFLQIRDFGIGMSPDDITQYLCDFGTSGWRSSRFRREYPGALASGYSSTGQYGIGFFSVFMIASDVRVVSRALAAGWADTHVLEFRNGVRHRPILRRAQASERLSEPGTEVILRLHLPLDEPDGLLFADAPYTAAQQRDWIRRLAMTCDHPIEVAALGETTFNVAVPGSDWRALDPGEIYDVLHSDPWWQLGPDDRIDGRSYFERMLAPLAGRDGTTAGLLAFRADVEEEIMTSADCFCGGFRSTNLYEMVGIAEGRPTRASRDRIALDVPIESMQDWIAGQWDRARGSEWSESQLIKLQWFSLGFGVQRDDAPLAFSADGLLTPSEVRGWISQRTVFEIARVNAISRVEIDGQQWMHTYQGLLRLPDNVLAVGYGARSLNDGLPLPPTDDLQPPGRQAGVDGFDGRAFWRHRYFDPDLALVRLAADAWQVSLEDVIDCLGVAAMVEDVDTRLMLKAYEGRARSVAGLRVSRP